MDGTTQTTAPTSATSSTQTHLKPATMSSTTQTLGAAETPADAGLFSADLLSSDVAAALPSGYKLRALRLSDYHNGFLDCLRVLTTVGDYTHEQFTERFEWIKRQDGNYFVVVIEDAGRVVGTGALIVERKLYVLACPLAPLIVDKFEVVGGRSSGPRRRVRANSKLSQLSSVLTRSARSF